MRLVFLTFVTSHKSRIVQSPMAVVMKSPISFTPVAMPMNTPVDASHIHQFRVNGLLLKERNFTQLKQAMMIKNISGRSNKMYLL